MRKKRPGKRRTNEEESLWDMGFGWEDGEESSWWSVDSFRHRVGLEFIRQSKWWGNNRHSSSSPWEGQTVKRTTPHMLCPTKPFKAKHCLCVIQALTKAYTGHYEQQTISWGRHDITKGIIPTLWQYVRHSKPESIPIASFNTICTLTDLFGVPHSSSQLYRLSLSLS